MIGGGVSGSRTGALGCGFASGGKGIGLGFGCSGSDGSCGVTGGISGFSIESANRLAVIFVKRFVSPLFERALVRPDVPGQTHEAWTNLRRWPRIQQSLNHL